MGFVGANRVMQYARAEVSLALHGPVDAATLEARLACCRSCAALRKADAPLVGYCTACRCPAWSRSELSTKAGMPGATCPLGRWNLSPAGGQIAPNPSASEGQIGGT